MNLNFRGLLHRIGLPKTYHSNGSGEGMSGASVWLFLILVGSLLLSLSIWYSTSRFIYWSNLEEHLSEDTVSGVNYDTASQAEVLNKFEVRESESSQLSNGRVNIVSTTTPPQDIPDEVTTSTNITPGL